MIGKSGIIEISSKLQYYLASFTRDCSEVESRGWGRTHPAWDLWHLHIFVQVILTCKNKNRHNI